MKQEELLAEWKKHDPFLSDLEGFERWLEGVWIYNPTYGSLQTKSLTDESLPEREVWRQSYVARERPLKTSEKVKLLAEGKMECYPDEFYLVGPVPPGTKTEALLQVVPRDIVETHLAQLKAFRHVDRNGEFYSYRDRLGNPELTISLHFVPGPLVDLINENPDAKAILALYEMIVDDAQSKYKKTLKFQHACGRHARRLVKAVRQVAAYENMKGKVPWLTKKTSENEEETLHV